MNLRDKRPTNYYKELCLELPTGREAQKNEMNSDNITQKRSGSLSDSQKQDKNIHRTAQLMVKLVKSINRHFLQLSLDNQRKITQENKTFDIQSFHSNSKKMISDQDYNYEFDKHGAKSCEISRAERRTSFYRQTSRPLNYASFYYNPKIESENGYNSEAPIFPNLKDGIPISSHKSKGKKHKQKKQAQQSPKMKALTHLTENDQKSQKAIVGNEYSQQCFKKFINTLLLSQRMKKSQEIGASKSSSQLKNLTKKITKPDNNSKDKVKDNQINRNQANSDILGPLFERKGSIGSQKISTIFQLKRSSFHIAIAYRIYLLQRKKLGFNFQKFQELDPTRFSRSLKKARQVKAKIMEEKKEVKIEQ